VLAAPWRSEGGPDANLIKSPFHKIEPTRVERHRPAAHSSEKAGANESNAPPKKILRKSLAMPKTTDKRVTKTGQEEAQKKLKKSLAMPKTTDKTVPPEEVAQ